MLSDLTNPLAQIAGLQTVGDARTTRYRLALEAHVTHLLADTAGELPSAVYTRTGDPRTVTAGAGYLAFNYALPGSRYFHDARLLAGVRAIFADVLAHQLDTGELACTGTAGVERPGAFPPHPHSSHGQSWYLEPLLFALTWMGAEFSPAERARIDRALYRTADFIAGRPIRETNNRGVIVCAVLALCGRYFGEPRYLELAKQWFHGEPSKVFDPLSGQICEGSGPDGNYSGTTFEYLYLYRLMSGDRAVDPQMIAALKWFACALDPNGYAMYAGAATRLPVTGVCGKLHDLLPALERYSRDEPFFQQLLEQYLATLEQHGALGREGHSISPTIWALLEHEPIAPPASAPTWYTDLHAWYHDRQTGPEHFVYNEGYESLYFPVRLGQTSTCVALRGRAPHKDLQSWTYGHERPVVYATAGTASRTRAWGVDTAVQNVSGVKIPDFCWVEGPAPGLLGRWEGLWRYYVFTPCTTLTITAGEVGRCETDWVVDPAVCGVPELAPGVLRYPGRQGRLHCGAEAPVRLEVAGVVAWRWTFAQPPFWFAFSDETFALRRAEPGQLDFTDASGAYAVTYSFATGTAPGEAGKMFARSQQGRLQVTRT